MIIAIVMGTVMVVLLCIVMAMAIVNVMVTGIVMIFGHELAMAVIRVLMFVVFIHSSITSIRGLIITYSIFIFIACIIDAVA